MHTCEILALYGFLIENGGLRINCRYRPSQFQIFVLYLLFVLVRRDGSHLLLLKGLVLVLHYDLVSLSFLLLSVSELWLGEFLERQILIRGLVLQVL